MLGTSITCETQDLSGKMFTFPKEVYLSSPVHVKIASQNLELGAATFCLRFFTDLTRNYIPFSLAKLSKNFPLIPNVPNAPEDVFKFVANKPKTDDITISVGGADARFHGQNVKLNTWQSVCGTWDADTGLTQLWLNGHPSTRQLTSKSHLNGVFSVTLGSETSLLSAIGVSLKQSFVGMMSDLQMWDYVLPRDQIQAYNIKGSVPNGNILTWSSLEFDVTGPIIIEDEQNI